MIRLKGPYLHGGAKRSSVVVGRLRTAELFAGPGGGTGRDGALAVALRGGGGGIREALLLGLEMTQAATELLRQLYKGWGGQDLRGREEGG